MSSSLPTQPSLVLGVLRQEALLFWEALAANTGVPLTSTTVTNKGESDILNRWLPYCTVSKTWMQTLYVHVPALLFHLGHGAVKLLYNTPCALKFSVFGVIKNPSKSPKYEYRST